VVCQHGAVMKRIIANLCEGGAVPRTDQVRTTRILAALGRLEGPHTFRLLMAG
jgi:hypothetical protein